MKKFKLLCTVAAVVLAVGMFTTTAMAASFTTITQYTTSGDARVKTTVTDISESDIGSQVTYIAYKNDDFAKADNILFIDQCKVESSADMEFSYTVPKAEFEGVKVTAIGLGSSGEDPESEDVTHEVIGGCIKITCNGNGTIKVAEADATVYPGNEAVLNIEPEDGYELYSLTVNGVEAPITLGATSYALAVEGYTEVEGTFMAIDVTLDPDVVDWTGENFLVTKLSNETVTGLFTDADAILSGSVELDGIEGWEEVNVIAVVGKLVGHPAYFDKYEYGLEVTYNDGTAECFHAGGINADGTFAVRLIDTTAEQKAFENVASFAAYAEKVVAE